VALKGATLSNPFPYERCRLGMVDAFTSPGASFSGIDGTDELYLSEVLHRAVVVAMAAVSSRPETPR